MSDPGTEAIAVPRLASRPLARCDAQLTASQRAAVERVCGLIDQIRDRITKRRDSARSLESGQGADWCGSRFDLDEFLGWREILEPEWVNVLGIVGGRAYGKTTALMTVLERLRSPYNDVARGKKAQGRCTLDGQAFPCDIVLPPINPEMFNGTPEFVLSWVFARLWKLLGPLEQLINEPWCAPTRRTHHQAAPPNMALYYTRLMESFQDVRSAITLLSGRYTEKAIQLSATRHEFQGEVFEQQRAGLELQHHIHTFFDALFDVIDGLGGGRSLLVIPFDDIDLAEERVAQLLHAVHAYLRHPRVVTILLGDWSAFSLALHREHAQGKLTSELLPGGDQMRTAVNHLVDAALLKFLPAQNIAQLTVDPLELYEQHLKDELHEIDELLGKIRDVPDLGSEEGTGTPRGFMSSLFSVEAALPTLPGEPNSAGEMYTRYVELCGRDLRNFNAIQSAFTALKSALEQLVVATANRKKAGEGGESETPPPPLIEKAKVQTLRAMTGLRSILAWSSRKAELTELFDEVIRIDWVRGAEIVDLRALTAARHKLAEKSFDRLALAVLLYHDLHMQVLPIVDPGMKLAVVGAPAGRRSLWRAVFANEVWPWIEDADLPEVSNAGQGAMIVLLAERLLEELGQSFRPQGGGSLTSYLASGIAGDDPLARMLVRTALVLAALQAAPETHVAQLREDTEKGNEGDETPGGPPRARCTSAEDAPANGADTGGNSKTGWLHRMDTWIRWACTKHSDTIRWLLSPEWYLTGTRMYRRMAVIDAGERPLAPYADLIRRQWYWKLLATGAARLSDRDEERLRELRRLLDPLARGVVAAEAMDLSELLALFQNGLVEVDEHGAWVVTGRGYDLLRELRKVDASRKTQGSTDTAAAENTEPQKNNRGGGGGVKDSGHKE